MQNKKHPNVTLLLDNLEEMVIRNRFAKMFFSQKMYVDSFFFLDGGSYIPKTTTTLFEWYVDCLAN